MEAVKAQLKKELEEKLKQVGRCNGGEGQGGEAEAGGAVPWG